MHHHDDHGHSHGVQSFEELMAMFKYMLHHNEHHTLELHEMAHNLEHLGYKEAVAELIEAEAAYSEGNKKLASALEKIEG